MFHKSYVYLFYGKYEICATNSIKIIVIIISILIKYYHYVELN